MKLKKIEYRMLLTFDFNDIQLIRVSENEWIDGSNGKIITEDVCKSMESEFRSEIPEYKTGVFYPVGTMLTHKDSLIIVEEFNDRDSCTHCIFDNSFGCEMHCCCKDQISVNFRKIESFGK